MPEFSAEDVARWCAGRWAGSPSGPIRGVSTDTRTIRKGDAFFAIQGPAHDGRRFLRDAFAAGASCAVAATDRATAEALPGAVLLVDDTLKALRALAGGYRSTLTAEMIAVTGSSGKTTVKEMIADVLGALGETARTCGNWNNDIGLPLSLLRAGRTSRFGVFEVGMNHPGELAPLCSLLRPAWGVITNIGPVHLEFFRSVEAIAREKAVVFESLAGDGTAVLCRDDAFYDLLRGAARGRTITTSLGGDADYAARIIDVVACSFSVTEKASGDTEELTIPLPGEHNVRNALQAVAVGRAHGLPWETIRAVLKDFRSLPMRWHRSLVGGVAVINDAYNANPMSMAAALEAFARISAGGRRWLVLGGMRELGPVEREEHEKLGRLVAFGPWAGLVTVGARGGWIADGAERAGMPPDRVVRCADCAEAGRTLKRLVAPGDAVLLKASRGEELEKVLPSWIPGE